MMFFLKYKKVNSLWLLIKTPVKPEFFLSHHIKGYSLLLSRKDFTIEWAAKGAVK
jgi:hypothetical protein